MNVYRQRPILLAALALLAAGAVSLSDALRSVAQSYYAAAGRIAPIAGRDTTMDYYQRLLDDAGELTASPPPGYPLDGWRALVTSFSQLDLSLARQLLAQRYVPMNSIRGLGETLVRSSKDGTMQPVAVYVPTTYSPQRPAPLVVFLHARLQAESHVVTPQYIVDLAEQSGTIVVAPYGRGSYDFKGAESDVYDAFDAAAGAFNVDPRRRYLAGYSMGAFSIFRIAPMHPADWSGLMCIAGALLDSRAARVVATMSSARFYILTGARDDNVPTLFPTITAAYLRDASLSVTFYSQPDGTHLLYSLRPILAQAWSDMEHGVVHLPQGLPQGAGLPSAGP